MQAFIAVLKVRFKDTGLEKIERREFEIQDSSRKRPINLLKPWDSVIMPGQKIDMSMIFREPNLPQGSCPGCQFINDGPGEDEVEWYVSLIRPRLVIDKIIATISSQGCSMTYWRIVEVQDTKSVQGGQADSDSPVSKIPSTASASLRQEVHFQSTENVNEIHQFRRVRVITRKPRQPNIRECQVRTIRWGVVVAGIAKCLTCFHCGEVFEGFGFELVPGANRNKRLDRITGAGDGARRFYCALDFHNLFSPGIRGGFYNYDHCIPEGLKYQSW
jgi:hypothetical protein